MGKTTEYPVKSHISFDALENPPWQTRTNERQPKTVTEMITQIKEYHTRWEQASAKNTYNEELVKKVEEQFLFNFIYHVNLEEGHGLTTSEETEAFLRNCSSGRNSNSFSLEEQETINLRVAYENLLAKINNEELASDYGLLEVSLLLKDFDDFYSLFKTCAWLLFELLDLHPFSDGNGRLCRILCSYSLSKLNPFPTPIYNVWTDSCKHDYIEALVEARRSPCRHPCALTTMMIECSYYGWESFFKVLDEEAKSRTCVKDASLIQTMAEECLLSPPTQKFESAYKHSHTLQYIPCSVQFCVC
ncbi:uncharacterized protein LOC110063939 [Orbicella faveolata]|uniref:uncharacterized protein LOC110063939 n=1 Tax=Orbicella faveolata TaxID=48498 RepID=UPI0009E200BD|nr:uncharacterized protein LOC110063939 [Orbicella faveolata]